MSALGRRRVAPARITLKNDFSSRFLLALQEERISYVEHLLSTGISSLEREEVNILAEIELSTGGERGEAVSANAGPLSLTEAELRVCLTKLGCLTEVDDFCRYFFLGRGERTVRMVTGFAREVDVPTMVERIFGGGVDGRGGTVPGRRPVSPRRQFFRRAEALSLCCNKVKVC